MSVSNMKFVVFGVVACAAIFGAVQVVRYGTDTILQQQALQSGVEFAGYIGNESPVLEQILSGDFDPEEAAETLHQLALIGNIFRFVFHDANNHEIFTTGSFHPASEGDEASHHAHDHDTSQTIDLPALARVPLLTERTNSAPSGSGHDHTPSTIHSTPLGDQSQSSSGPVGSITDDLRIYSGDGESAPTTFGVFSHSFVDGDGNIKGAMALYQDLTLQSNMLRSVLIVSVVGIIALIFLSTVGPIVSFFRSQRAKTVAEERIHYLAAHDGLTGLANRDTFIRLLEDCFAEGASFAVHFVDIDNFKGLNDSLGHEIGDTVLTTCGSRIGSIPDADVIVARLGGDEFSVLQRDVKSAECVTSLSEKLVARMQEPITTAGHSVVATVSVGSALAPVDGANATRILKSADIAMYHAKSEGRNRAFAFQSWMDEKLMARREVESRLHWALSNNGFEINYQPLYSAKTSELSGFEALLRLRKEDGTPISPIVFIPIAEEMGLIEDIGTWVLYHACEFASGWPTNLKLAVNLSVGQFISGKLPEIVESVLWDAKLAPGQLELEITESHMLADAHDTLLQLQDLKALGVAIAMDDFGTGYSSLAYLWKFPFDKIKIDQSFLQGFDDQAQQITKIVETIVGLGHTLGMQITAEGVETGPQFEMLQAVNCDQLQGYLLGKPEAEGDVLIRIDADQRGRFSDLPNQAS